MKLTRAVFFSFLFKNFAFLMSKNLSTRTNIQQSQEHIENLNKIADQTDEHLRQALEHAAIRHEQLDQLHIRSQEMLNKNENLVFGKNAKKKIGNLFFPLYYRTSFNRKLAA